MPSVRPFHDIIPYSIYKFFNKLLNSFFWSSSITGPGMCVLDRDKHKMQCHFAFVQPEL